MNYQVKSIQLSRPIFFNKCADSFFTIASRGGKPGVLITLVPELLSYYLKLEVDGVIIDHALVHFTNVQGASLLKESDPEYVEVKTTVESKKSIK